MTPISSLGASIAIPTTAILASCSKKEMRSLVMR
ncbi:MAG: Vmc-like lipoprotein signal peptide domain-containing protein [Sphingobium sp.]